MNANTIALLVVIGCLLSALFMPDTSYNNREAYIKKWNASHPDVPVECQFVLLNEDNSLNRVVDICEFR